MRYIILISLFLFNFNLFAYEQELLRLFLANNSLIVQSRASAQERALDVASVIAAKGWGLALGSSYYQNKLDGTVVQGANNRHELSLAKDFFWGGHLSFSTGYGKVDTYANAFMPLAQSNYEFTQTFAYTQDLGSNFFGINDRLDLDVAKKGALFTQAETNLAVDSALFSFNSLLIELRLNKTLIRLENDALKRAIKRERMIKKRVRDGLLEKVDHYQASMAVLIRDEAVKSSNMNQDLSLKKIVGELHQEIDLTQVKLIENIESKKIPSGDWSSSLENKQLQKRIDLLKSSVRKVNYSFMPDLKLSTMYKTNSYEESSSDAISKGNLGGDKGELSVGISLSMPLFFQPQRVEKQKINIQLKAAQSIYESRQKSFEREGDLTKRQIDSLQKNIDSSKERVSLAQKVLREYNKLYNLGRADLDQVIRAEEDLINTQKSFISYLAQHKGMKASLSFMLGTLQQYLLEK